MKLYYITTQDELTWRGREVDARLDAKDLAEGRPSDSVIEVSEVTITKATEMAALLNSGGKKPPRGESVMMFRGRGKG